MKTAYLVKIGWRCEFMFDNINDAGTFAAQAANHRTEDSDNDKISITLIDLDKSEEVDDD